MGEVLAVGADAAEDAEDGLHEERRLDQAAVEEVSEIVEMADVVAFELEARAVALAQVLKNALDILECVAEYQIVACLRDSGVPSRA